MSTDSKAVGVPPFLRTREERAYDLLCEAAKHGTGTGLHIRHLVLAIKAAVDWGCITTARYGLEELEARTDTQHLSERSAA